MPHSIRIRAFALALLSSLGCASALAQVAPMSAPIDANTFIVGHPAGPNWKHVHANSEHPAVQFAALKGTAVVDPNRFIVLPPAQTSWTVASERLNATRGSH